MSGGRGPALWWTRRDLRLHDNPAAESAAATGPVLALFVLDPRLIGGPVRPRDAWIAATVLALDESLDGGLCLRVGRPRDVVPATAAAVGARAVHVTGETTPYGVGRDEGVRRALAEADVDWVASGTPYAADPGSVTKPDGTAYRVFGPFEKAWRRIVRPEPAGGLGGLDPVPDPDPDETDRVRTELAALVAASPVDLPAAGEAAARTVWADFRRERLDRYADSRDRPGVDATSRLSPHLKSGAIHPRTLLADLAGRTDAGAAKFVAELGWREFYADVLARHPSTLGNDLTDALAGMRYDEPGEDFRAWQRGETGYPLVDAGMRQLRSEGWMHNRVRMVAAGFLVKDLHVWWPHGARHFMDLLIDGDPASNAHGWQWVAGTGTDAAPYFRVFNPTAQAKRFDPDGVYVRRHLPELAHLPGAAAVTPWTHPDGYRAGYPRRLVDHGEERLIALDRYRARRRA